MIQITKLSDGEKFEMYTKRTTHEELARMHIELEKHIPPPHAYCDSLENQPIKDLLNQIKYLLDKFCTETDDFIKNKKGIQNGKKEYVPYQLCPVCYGSGELFTASPANSVGWNTCHACDGRGVILMEIK